MIILMYATKKEMKEKLVGKPVTEMRYQETSMFGEEVSSNCSVTGSNRPSITGITKTNAKGVRTRATEFFASVKIVDGIVKEVS